MSNGLGPLFDPANIGKNVDPASSSGALTQKLGFPYQGRAVIVIDGSVYWEWESVSVRAAAYENTRTARFTCSEQTPTPKSWSAMRIVPGQKCTVLLDGYLAMTGEVITRQVFYDATQHTVEIQAQGKSGRMSNASVVSQTGNWKNIDFRQLAQTLAQPFGVNVSGQPGSNQQFPRVSTTPGESPWELMEQHARATKTPLSENAQGEIVMGVMGMGASVIEGVNILEGREVIHSLMGVGGGGVPGAGEGSDYTSMGQRPGTDDDWGAKANQVHSEKPPIDTAFSQGFLPKSSISEVPAWMNQQMDNRSNMEAMYSSTLQIWVNVTTLGWQRNCSVPGAGGLWEPFDKVTVLSPMLVMYGQTLQLKAVTWTQDNTSGTRSHVELVNDKAMGGSGVPGSDPGSGGGGNGGGPG